MIPDLSNDAVLVAVLSAALDDLDPVPVAAVRAASAACGLRHLDSELALLVADSTVDDPILLRDGTDTTTLTFRSAELTLEIDIDPEGRAVGVISPPRATRVVIETATARGAPLGMRTRSDDLGRFQIGVGAGLCRVRIGSGTHAVVTSWFYC